MSDDPWKEFRIGAEVGEAPSGPVETYLAPGLTTPRPPPPELRAAPGEQYRAAALADRERAVRAGIPLGEGYTDRLARGVGFGWTDELMAAGGVPFEMIRRGMLNPAEAYRYTKAREDLRTEQMLENTKGFGGGAAEVMGGMFGAGTSGALGAGRAALSRMSPNMERAANYALSIGKGAGLGAVAGAGEAPDIAGIPRGMMMGGVFGAGIGAVAPPVIATGAHIARGLQMPRLRDPEKVATEQLADVARRAGVSGDEMVRSVTDAAAAGQPFTVADALGKEGQRKLTAMAKTPGEQRALITEALTARDLNMPHRVGQEVGQAFGAPGTSEAAREALIARAKADAEPLYARAEAYPTWSNRLQQFFDDPIARPGLRQGVELQRLEAVGNNRPFNPRDAMITDFDAAGDPIITGVPNMRTIHTLKVGLDKMIDGERNEVTGGLTARGRALLQFQQGLLREVDEINPAYAEARRAYAGPMSIADAVRVGEQMPRRGRAADTVPAFEALPAAQQQGVRIGYADAVREPLERTGNLPTILREKSPKGAAELEALSLYQGPRRPGEPDQLRKFLNREETMQRASKNALGGSATVENAADVADTPAAAEVIGGALSAAASGNPLSFSQRMLHMFDSARKGESEAQRMAITRALLSRDPNMVEAMAARIAAEQQRRAMNPFVYRSPFRP